MVLNALAQTWIAVNGWWMSLVQEIDWRVSGLEGLQQRAWYLVSSNHQTWEPISWSRRCLPAGFRFSSSSCKRELMYVPFMGAGLGAGFSFMRRSGGGRDFAKDLSATQVVRAIQDDSDVGHQFSSKGTRVAPK